MLPFSLIAIKDGTFMCSFIYLFIVQTNNFLSGVL